MLLTIIIPCYNIAAFIAEAVESALCCANDRGAEVELIVVDDGSTDDTAAVASRMLRHRPEARIIMAGHGGVSQARNIGLNAAQGKYVVFLDGDDMLDADGLDALLRIIADDPEADMIIMDMLTIGRNEYDYDWRGYFAQGITYRAEQIVYSPYYRHTACGAAYRREAIRGITFDTALCNSEDAIWVNTLFASGLSALFVGAVLYRRRIRQGSASRVYDEKRIENDWAALLRCSQLAAHSASLVAQDAYSQLAYDLAHNMILHAIKACISLAAMLRAHPLARTLGDLPTHTVPAKRRLIKYCPMLYAALLSARQRWRSRGE